MFLTKCSVDLIDNVYMRVADPSPSPPPPPRLLRAASDAHLAGGGRGREDCARESRTLLDGLGHAHARPRRVGSRGRPLGAGGSALHWRWHWQRGGSSLPLPARARPRLRAHRIQPVPRTRMRRDWIHTECGNLS